MNYHAEIYFDEKPDEERIDEIMHESRVRYRFMDGFGYAVGGMYECSHGKRESGHLDPVAELQEIPISVFADLLMMCPKQGSPDDAPYFVRQNSMLHQLDGKDCMTFNGDVKAHLLRYGITNGWLVTLQCHI